MFTHLLTDLAPCPQLQQWVEDVLSSLPTEVKADLLSDRHFRIILENYTPGVGWRMFMQAPTLDQPVVRCVVLRPRLENASAEFAQYVIAHELAHAFLHNGGWGDISDPEEAADALAASWGYPLRRKA